MSGDLDLERLLADWMASAAPSRAPSQAVDDAISTTGQRGPRPTLLALMRTSPMTTRPTTLVGSWPMRAAYLLTILVVAIALAATSILIGARYLAQAADPTGPNGLIAVDSEGDILIADPDGTHARLLTTGPDIDIQPSFSPDGHRLAYFSTPAEGGAARLILMRPDGSDRREIDAAPGWLFKTAIMGSPNISWSPDATRIATVVAGGTGSTLAVVDVGSGAFEPLEISSFDATFVSWSPDGEWLAYIGRTLGGEVFLIHPDGTEERSVSPTAADGPSYLSVDWSPDSRHVTYSRSNETDDGFDAYAVDLARMEETLLAGDEPGVGNLWWPTYSPVGARLASGGDLAGAAAVYTGRADGTDWSPLAIPSPVTTEDVTWSPDGTSLLVFSHDLASLLLVPIDAPAATVTIATGESLGSPSWQRVVDDAS
jgi:Tol biopolymer transport system component